MTKPADSSLSVTGGVRPLERLEAEIVELASQLTAASARLTGLIGEFDAAEGWRGWGMRSTAHWLSWQCGMTLGAAREQVRVARRLCELPVIAADYAAGRLSYAKVRALTRFATPESEAELAGVARCATGGQIERLARAARGARTGADVRRQYAAAYLTVKVADDGSVTGSFRLPPAEGGELVRALQAGAGRLPDYGTEGDAAGDEPDRDRDTPADGSGRDAAEGAACRRGAQRRVSPRGYAWVLTAMARHYLDALTGAATPRQAERFQLVVHATRDQLAAADDDCGGEAAALADGTRLHPATVRRLSCDCPTSTLVEGSDGTPLHLGRRTRRISRRLRRAVDARDHGRCRAPGCTEPATQIHHVRHWANGGSTCLPNLTSLCDAHHWLVHEGGFTLVARAPGSWALLAPDRRVVEPEPPSAEPASPLRPDPNVAADAVTGHWNGTPLDRYALDVILTTIGAHTSTDPEDVSAETFPAPAAA